MFTINNKLSFVDLYIDAPLPRKGWLEMPKDLRITSVMQILNSTEREILSVCGCEDNGYVYIEFKKPVPAGERGNFLLDVEMKLKTAIDNALSIWHLPQGDKSSLRKLRGVGVKS